jgi:hypothetical protein
MYGMACYYFFEPERSGIIHELEFRYKDYLVSPRVRKISLHGLERLCAEFVMVHLGEASRAEIFSTEQYFDSETEALDCARQRAIAYIDELLP